VTIVGAHGIKLGLVHRGRFALKVEVMLADAPDLRLAIERLAL
jgi:transposase